MIGDGLPDVLQFKDHGCAQALITDESIEFLDEVIAHGLQGERKDRIMGHLRDRQMKIDNGGDEAGRKMHTLLDTLHEFLQVTDLQFACTRSSQFCRSRLYGLAGFE